MFAGDVIESFLMIGVITAAFVYYGIVFGRKEARTHSVEAARVRKSA